KKFFAYKKAAEAELQFKPILGKDELLEIPLTEHQHILYKGGLKKLQEATCESNGRKRAQLSFGALHLMKAVCAEPYCLPGTKFVSDPGGTQAHLANSPKLNWLLDRLSEIAKAGEDRKSTRLNSSHVKISYAVFCLKKKNNTTR